MSIGQETTAALTVAAGFVGGIVAKTGDKIQDRIADGLVNAILGRPTEEAGLGRLLVEWKHGNIVKVLLQAEARSKARGGKSGKVKLDFLLPLLEAAGYVDSSNLQRMFAELLVRCVENDRFVQPLYVDTLKRLSPEDARRFLSIGGMTIGHDSTALPLEVLPELCDTNDRDFIDSFVRLHALGLVEGSYDGPEPKVGHKLVGRASALGRRFYDVVTGPGEIEPE